MLSVLILSFIAGIFLAGGVPHFIKGVTGQKYATMLNKSGAATTNVVVGWLSFLIAVLVWHIAPMRHHPRAAFIGLMVGVLVMALILAQMPNKKSVK